MRPTERDPMSGPTANAPSAMPMRPIGDGAVVATVGARIGRLEAGVLLMSGPGATIGGPPTAVSVTVPTGGGPSGTPPTGPSGTPPTGPSGTPPTGPSGESSSGPIEQQARIAVIGPIVIVPGVRGPIGMVRLPTATVLSGIARRVRGRIGMVRLPTGVATVSIEVAGRVRGRIGIGQSPTVATSPTEAARRAIAGSTLAAPGRRATDPRVRTGFAQTRTGRRANDRTAGHDGTRRRIDDDRRTRIVPEPWAAGTTPPATPIISTRTVLMKAIRGKPLTTAAPNSRAATGLAA